jgi:hypothetical protein
MSDHLELALTKAGGVVEYPPTPDLWPDVDARLDVATGSSHRARWWLVAAAAVIVVLAVALPGPRAAIADLLGLGAVQISVVDGLPEAVSLRDPTGEKLTAEAARDLLAYPILTPGEEPAFVYVDAVGGIATAAYRPGPGGYGLLITQFPAGTDEFAVQKLIGPGTSITPVVVGGTEGFWVEGDPHVVVLLDADGNVIQDEARLAGNTLLFERDGVTIRIEGNLDLGRALEIAARLS